MPIALAFPEAETNGHPALYFVSKTDKNTVNSFLVDGFEDVEKRVVFFLGMAAQLKMSHRVNSRGFGNLVTLEGELRGERWEEKGSRILSEVLKLTMPKYNSWGIKKGLQFQEFCQTLGLFYLVTGQKKDGNHFFRRSTEPYRKKHHISRETKWGEVKGKDKPFENKEFLIGLGVPEKELEDENDGVQVDHILSCQVRFFFFFSLFLFFFFFFLFSSIS